MGFPAIELARTLVISLRQIPVLTLGTIDGAIKACGIANFP
jgi:hypothetical protein